MIDNPTNLPSAGEIIYMEEPFVHATIYTPQEYVGTLMELCQDKRGVFIDMQYEGNRVKLNYDLPLNEIIFDFFDHQFSLFLISTPRKSVYSPRNMSGIVRTSP